MASPSCYADDTETIVNRVKGKKSNFVTYNLSSPKSNLLQPQWNMLSHVGLITPHKAPSIVAAVGSTTQCLFDLPQLVSIRRFGNFRGRFLFDWRLDLFLKISGSTSHVQRLYSLPNLSPPSRLALHVECWTTRDETPRRPGVHHHPSKGDAAVPSLPHRSTSMPAAHPQQVCSYWHKHEKESPSEECLQC